MSGELKTYGEKPKPFQLEKDGEWYYVGSQVNACIGSCCLIIAYTNKK